jgi:hypothetical protein
MEACMRLIMNQGQKHTIYGKVVCGGEEFEVPDNEAVVWVKIGRAKEVRGERLRKNRYSRSDMRAEDE